MSVYNETDTSFIVGLLKSELLIPLAVSVLDYGGRRQPGYFLATGRLYGGTRRGHRSQRKVGVEREERWGSAMTVHSERSSV